MTLYLKVTSDRYELPLAVADSVKELSAMVGVKRNSIKTMIWKDENGIKKGCYKKVIIEEKNE